MRSPRQLKRSTLAMAVSALLLWSAGQARAANMVLTPAGIAQGFTLSTFASGFPFHASSNPLDRFGPTGIAYPGSGVVLVADTASGDVYRFPTDTDGQTASPANVLGSYPPPLGPPVGLVSFNGVTAMVLAVSGQLVTLNPNTGSTSLIVSGLPSVITLDVVANPLNGHYFVSVDAFSPGTQDVNPITHTFTPFGSMGALTGGDGLTISADGKTLYATANISDVTGFVTGFDTATGAQVLQTSNIVGNPDGSALGAGTLAGKLFVNTHAGTLIEIDTSTNVQTVIASGGSRGDFIKADPYNGSLLLTQTDSVLRLTPPPGGGFGGPAVPEPSRLALFACGGAVLAAWHWRRKRQPA